MSNKTSAEILNGLGKAFSENAGYLVSGVSLILGGAAAVAADNPAGIILIVSGAALTYDALKDFGQSLQNSAEEIGHYERVSSANNNTANDAALAPVKKDQGPKNML